MEILVRDQIAKMTVVPFSIAINPTAETKANPWEPFMVTGGEYQGQQFRSEQRIESIIFPQLNLTANQIFAAGQ
jgi:Uma2 family endonuclease